MNAKMSSHQALLAPFQSWIYFYPIRTKLYLPKAKIFNQYSVHFLTIKEESRHEKDY